MSEFNSDGCPCCDRPLPVDDLFTGRDRWQGVAGFFDVCACAHCGAGVTRPRVPDDELSHFYPDTYAPYVPVERGPAAMIWRFLQRRQLSSRPFDLLAKDHPGRLLDVGCGRGDLATQAIERGWTATGIDPSDAACDVARARGIDARPGTLRSVAVESSHYDVVVMQHALEHLADPLSDLERTRDALRPDGHLLVIIPNFACWQRRRFGSHWFHLDLPRHRTHFTPNSLSTVLERAGLEPLEIGTATSAVGLPGSIQYRIFGRCVFPSGLRLRLATAFAYALLPLSLLLNRIRGGGDFLWAVARRPSSE